jgi:transposase
MPRNSKRPSLNLTSVEISTLKKTAKSQRVEKRQADRAKILLYYQEQLPITQIAKKVGIGRPAVYKCIDKAIAMGFEAGLKDLPHNPKKAIISLQDKSWVTHLACTQPKDLGLAAELWSRQALANYVREHAKAAGHAALERASKATIQRILAENKLQPDKIKYYLEKRDPDFEEKMKNVLLVYQELQLINNNKEQNKSKSKSMVSVCVDEKPGVQALSNTAPDLACRPLEHEAIGRDYEYIRHGTASILAGIDLEDGHVFCQVHRRHSSGEFIELLKELDNHYDKDLKISIILDNHSCHVSKETRAYLATRPGRFIYVHTPKDGSWLNLAETLFSKMARTFLKQIRVESWDDLKGRILKGVEEINSNPVVHKWTKFSALETNNL